MTYFDYKTQLLVLIFLGPILVVGVLKKLICQLINFNEKIKWSLTKFINFIDLCAIYFIANK